MLPRIVCALFQAVLSALGFISGNQDRYDRLIATVISGCERVIEAINTRLNQLPITRVDIKAGPLCTGIVMLQGPQVSRIS